MCYVPTTQFMMLYVVIVLINIPWTPDNNNKVESYEFKDDNAF